MHHFSARWARLAGLVGVFALLIPLVTAGAAAQDGGEKVLRIHHLVYPDIIDPQKSSYTMEIDIIAMAYEGLTRLDENLATVPAAAESWEFNEDGTVVTFTLREGLQYSDGSPLTAENFRFAIERTCDPNTGGEYQYILFDIAGCAEFAGLYAEDAATPVAADDTEAYEAARENLGARAIDERTLEVTLNQPAPYFPTVAGLWVMYPTKPESVESGEDWWTDPANHVGNGPFTITQLEDQQLVTFEPNENYWGGRPVLDGLEYVYVDEPDAALEAYRAGDLDILQIDPAQIPVVRDDPELGPQLLDYPQASTFAMEFNLTQEPFEDKKVREAFAYAFDRETYCAEIRNGDCIPTFSWVPEGIPGAIETDAYAFDPERAKQALAESTYGGPEGLPEIKLFYNSDNAANRARHEYIAGMYRDNLGVEITLEPTEGTTLASLSKDVSTHPQMVIGGWIQDYPDPQNWLSVYWSCGASFATNVGFCSEEFDSLVKQGDTELDPEQRIAPYEQAGQVLIDELPAAFLFNLANNFLVKPNVTGYATTASDDQWPGQWASPLTIDVER